MKVVNGVFNNEKRKFILENMYSSRRQLNYLWNEEMVAEFDQFCNGYSWNLIGKYRRMIDKGDRNLFINDRNSNVVFSANNNYDNLLFDKFYATIGMGYNSITSIYKDIKR